MYFAGCKQLLLNLLSKVIKAIYSIYALLLFVVLMLVLLPFIFIASFWGKVSGGNVIYNICKVWGHIWTFLVGIRHYNIYDALYNHEKQYIFVANHISYMDVPVMIKVMEKQNFRILGKAEIAKVPIFGFIYKKAVVMVDRKSPKDRAESIRILMSVIRKNISVFIFPEGTFNETGQPLKHFFDGAFRVAIETGTPIKPIIFLDAYDRLNYNSIFSLTPGRSRAVFLEEIITEGLAIQDLPNLKATVHKNMEAALIKYNASWIHNFAPHLHPTSVHGK